MIATQIKKQKILIIFDDIIAHMISKRNLQPIVVELFIRGGRKLSISLVFTAQSYFDVLKKYYAESCPLLYHQNSQQIAMCN